MLRRLPYGRGFLGCAVLREASRNALLTHSAKVMPRSCAMILNHSYSASSRNTCMRVLIQVVQLTYTVGQAIVRRVGFPVAPPRRPR